MTPAPEPFACAVVIVAAMSGAGLAHTLWMRSRLSRRFSIPLDAGMTWRGRRLLGAHKTLRGFMVIVPSAGLAFTRAGVLREALPGWLAAGIWQISPGALFWLGAWAGFCFMAGELPNSFYKRRRGIASGRIPAAGCERFACLFADRVDSTLGLLIGVSCAVPVPGLSWIWILLLGPVAHLGFSALLYLAGVKARLA